MPLRVSSNSKGTWITWETPDESVSSTFRIKPEDPEEKILETLVKAVRFISAQTGQLQLEIAELEAEIVGGPASTATNPTKRSVTSTGPATLPDPSAPRVPMMPPASLSDQPAGGPPVQTFGWGSMPTRHVPPELAADWSLIPPGEEA